MSKFLVSTTEVFRVDTDEEAKGLIEEAKRSSMFELGKYSSEFKVKKQKGEIVDEWYKVTLVKHFNSSPEMARVVGNMATGITTYDALGVMMCDAWREELGCDIAIENYGGVRYDVFPSGPITVKDILNLDPFMNTAVVMNITGKELSDMLIACYKYDRNRFPITSGCTAVVTYTDSSKSQIKKLELYGSEGKKLDMKKKYKVMANNYVASIADSPRQDQGESGTATTASIIIDWLEKVGTVDYSGRTSFTEKW